jgi:hypothetical protein
MNLIPPDRHVGGHDTLLFIPKMVENLAFGCVSFAANFSPVPRALPMAMVARRIQKICAASLPNSQIFNHFRYNLLFMAKVRKKLKQENQPTSILKPWLNCIFVMEL